MVFGYLKKKIFLVIERLALPVSSKSLRMVDECFFESDRAFLGSGELSLGWKWRMPNNRSHQRLSRVGVFGVHYFMLKKNKKCRQGQSKEEADLFRKSEKNIAVGSVLREGVLLSAYFGDLL